MKESSKIHHVSDTALWVAVYRAQETERKDALFRDPLAAKLAGSRGFQIASKMGSEKYTAWSLVIRTVVIDNYIHEALKAGVETIVNLGAGLDSRPYRMDLPPNLLWIEVDFPHMIDHKMTTLKDEKPKCRLERVSLDLSDRPARQQLFAQIASRSNKTLIITEGVTPYLDMNQVAELADDLRAQSSFVYWITDYISPRAIAFIRRKRKKDLENAPMKFSPPDWFGFFKEHGWRARETRFLIDESERMGRSTPKPWWAHLLMYLPFAKPSDEYRKMVAYVLLEPNSEAGRQ